tara:strand:+ start:373 stop:714 length:342 start_codon:yes stop_codon:yes gene_type:complete
MNNFDLIEITKKNIPIADLDVWLGYKKKVKTYVNQDVYKTIPKARKRYIKTIIEYNGPIEAPIKKNDIVGTMKVFYKDELLNEYKVLAFEDVKKVNIFSRLIKSINYLIWGDV